MLFNQQTEVCRYRYIQKATNNKYNCEQWLIETEQKMAAFETCFHRLNTLPNQLDFEVVTPVIQYARFSVII